MAPKATRKPSTPPGGIQVLGAPAPPIKRVSPKATPKPAGRITAQEAAKFTAARKAAAKQEELDQEAQSAIFAKAAAKANPSPTSPKVLARVQATAAKRKGATPAKATMPKPPAGRDMIGAVVIGKPDLVRAVALGNLLSKAGATGMTRLEMSVALGIKEGRETRAFMALKRTLAGQGNTLVPVRTEGKVRFHIAAVVPTAKGGA
jgi:hypothetical protein